MWNLKEYTNYVVTIFCKDGKEFHGILWDSSLEETLDIIVSSHTAIVADSVTKVLKSQIQAVRIYNVGSLLAVIEEEKK